MQKEDDLSYPKGPEELLPESNDDNLDEVIDPLYDVVIEPNTEIGPSPDTEYVVFQPESRLQSFQELTSSKRKGKRIAVWERKDRMLELAEAGLSKREIAEKLGVPIRVINFDKSVIEGVLESKLTIVRPKSERPKAVGKRIGETQKKFIAKMEEFERNHPGEKFRLTDWSGELGVTRERLRQIYNALNTKRTLPPRRTYFLGNDYPEIDRNVKELLDQGLAKEEIKRQLSLNTNALNYSLARLKSNNEINRPLFPRDKKIDERRKKIQELKSHGLNNKEIMKILEIERGMYYSDIAHLRKSGLLQRERRPRSTHETLSRLDSQVKQLREDDLYLTIAQMATLLKVPPQHIMASLTRLKKNSNESIPEHRSAQRLRVRRQAIFALFQERRYTLHELKERFNMSENVLRIDLKALGLKPFKLKRTKAQNS